jgi:hypothetical protein
VEPDIFRHLLFYVYGGSVPEEVLKQHAKEIIDTADKYSLVNLKLAAESVYVEPSLCGCKELCVAQGGCVGFLGRE